jgi:GTPase SAR1 family protein
MDSPDQRSNAAVAVIILVGNKSDLTEQREVTEETGREYAERCGLQGDGATLCMLGHH